jgi:HrpA-like RNA helicase
MPPTLLVKGNLLNDPDCVPIDYVCDYVSERISKRGVANRVFIVHASTGSGKSTIIPPELYRRLNEKLGRRNILCTQPRVLTAIELPIRVTEFIPEMKMGKNIGYQTGTTTLKPRRGVTYMTSGVLMNQLNTMTDEEFIAANAVIVLDEVHERNASADYVMYAMKKMLERLSDNPKCPFVLLMSATMDPEKMSRYFLGKVIKGAIATVRGFSFNITKHFLPVATSNLYGDIAKIVAGFPPKADDGNPNNAIIFVPGIDSFLEAALIAANKTDSPYAVIRLTSESVKKQEADIAEDLKKMKVTIAGKLHTPVRKVFIATNVAETGLTIPGLKHVIDMGLVNNSEYNPYLNCKLLVMRPVTRFMHMQRCGRVGRESNGDAWLMYTEDMMKSLPEDTFPDLVRSEITMEILAFLLKEHGMRGGALLQSMDGDKQKKKSVDLFKIDLLDQLPAINVHSSLEKLYVLGMIDRNCVPTNMGIAAAKFRLVSPEGIRAVMSAYSWDACVLDVATMIASVGAKICDRAHKNEFAKYISKFNTFKISCDFVLNLLIIYDFAAMAARHGAAKLRDMCRERGINYDAMMGILYIRTTICEALYDMGFDIRHEEHKSIIHEPSIENISLLKQCLLEGYKMNILIWDRNSRSYVSRKAHMSVGMPKTPSLVGNPRCLLCSGIEYRLKFGRYAFTTDMISVLDGFVEFDETYDAL